VIVMMENETRTLRRKIMLYVGIAILLLIAFAVFYISQPLLWNPKPQSLVKVDPSRLEAHVRRLCDPQLPRGSSRPENLDLVAEYIRSEFVKANGKVSDQPYPVKGRTYRNVIAVFGPDTNERVVIGAHYDTAGGRPGADDNASGIAGLIELAHLLGKATLPLKVELVAFTLEEPPFFRTEHMGSAVHANSLKREGAAVRAMLSLEMIGYFSDAKDSQAFPIGLLALLYPTTGNFISVIGKTGQASLVRRIKRAMAGASTLPIYSMNAPASIPGVDFSDHLNYWHVGYPAAMISDTSFYRNPHYHTDADTPEKLNYPKMAQVVEGLYAAVIALSK
jgi:hypothetical protein